jgi:hypothetical protein
MLQLGFDRRKKEEPQVSSWANMWMMAPLAEVRIQEDIRIPISI